MMSCIVLPHHITCRTSFLSNNAPYGMNYISCVDPFSMHFCYFNKLEFTSHSLTLAIMLNTCNNSVISHLNCIAKMIGLVYSWLICGIQKCATWSVHMASVRTSGACVSRVGAAPCVINSNVTIAAPSTASVTTARASVNRAGTGAIVHSVSFPSIPRLKFRQNLSDFWKFSEQDCVGSVDEIHEMWLCSVAFIANTHSFNLMNLCQDINQDDIHDIVYYYIRP